MNSSLTIFYFINKKILSINYAVVELSKKTEREKNIIIIMTAGFYQYELRS